MVVRILQGDALAVLRTLESESVQMCVTSPPYYALRDYGVDGQIGLERTPLAFLEALWDVFDEVRRVLRSDGLCFVNIGDSYAGSGKGPSNSLQRPASCLSDRQLEHGSAPKAWIPIGEGLKPKDLMLIPQRFAIGMQDRGWWVRSCIAWCKTSAMPESVRDRPTSAWEPIWMFSKSARYFYAADAVRTNVGVPMEGKASFRTGGAYVNGKGFDNSVSKDWQHDSRTVTNTAGASLRNYWLLGPEPSREEHYAGFVTELPRRCILAGSRKGDTVLDPFLGSGTTLMVASRLGRDGVGIELNPDYCRMAEARIQRDAGSLFPEDIEVETAYQPDMFDSVAG